MLVRTINEGELRKYHELGLVTSIRVFSNPNKTFSLAVSVKSLPEEQTLISKRQTQRAWTSLDRLLQTVERLGIPVTVDLKIPIRENRNEYHSSS